MKLPKFLLALPILGLILSSYAVHPYAEQLEASKSQPFIRRALDQDRAAKEEAVRNMNSLSAFIKSKAEETKLETRADLFGRIKTRLEGERKYLGVVDTILEPLSGGITTTWSLETHKMGLALKDLLESYLTEDNLAKVVGGTHLFDTTLTEDSFPAVLNTGFWGTTQAPRYALFLLSVAAELMNPTGKTPITAVDTLKAAGVNIDESPIAHIVPLPNNLTNWPDYIKNSLFFVPDYHEGRPGFLQTHSGFLFGGHRNVDESSALEPRYPHGKLFGPEDCSSSIGKIYEYKGVIATLYQWMFVKSRFEEESYESILLQAGTTAAADIRAKVAELGAHFEAVPAENLTAGDIIGWRTQAAGRPLGTGGHTGIFIGKSHAGNPLFLGPNRGLPQLQMDGFGIEEKTMPEGAQIFAMRAKEKSTK